jgi:hypothetical protein
MVMKIKRRSYLLLALLLPLAAGAQDDDFGIWYSATAKVGITNRIDADISAELRTYNNAGNIEQAFLEAGVDYKLTDFLSAGASYRITEAFEDDLKYHPQHKIFLELKANIKPGNFTFQGRVRYQTRFKTYFQDADDEIPDHTLRIRLKAIYRTPALPLNPFIYSETFIPLFRDSERFVGKNRLAAGVEFKITGRHSIEAAYLFQRDWLPKLADEHIINVGYNLKF